MTVFDELALSYYRPVADIHTDHGVRLVQHIGTGKFYVQKTLTVYNIEIFRKLKENPIPNTPQIFELVEDGASLIIVEEYLQGQSLQELLDENTHFDEAEVFSIAMQLSLIIKNLHHMTPPIIHRDIKPSNVILSPDHAVKLLDFNAAKIENESETRDTRLLGTFGFAAPEQYGFAASNTQTDLYAFGALINVLLTGVLPAKNLAKGPFSRIVKKCTELDPKNRFTDIDALIAALRKTEHLFDSDNSFSLKKSKARFLPPGFRSGNPGHIAAAICGYVFIFWMGFSITSDSVSDSASPLCRILYVLMMLAIIFFTFDYFNLQCRLPLTKSSSLPKRTLGILLYDMILFFLFIIILAVIL